MSCVRVAAMIAVSTLPMPGTNKPANIAVIAGAVLVFALSLALVRGQATVVGLSDMRAMA